jgi:hypothetical protein
LSAGILCPIDYTLNNTANGPYGEDGISCEEKVYLYPSKPKPESHLYHNLDLLYEHNFEVRGYNDQMISYWYEMTIGFNFLVSSGLKVFLSQGGHEIDHQDPYKCLYDKQCVLASLSDKGVLKVDAIITSGEYKLSFFELTNIELRNFLVEDSGL